MTNINHILISCSLISTDASLKLETLLKPKACKPLVITCSFSIYNFDYSLYLIFIPFLDRGLEFFHQTQRPLPVIDAKKEAADQVCQIVITINSLIHLLY